MRPLSRAPRDHRPSALDALALDPFQMAPQRRQRQRAVRAQPLGAPHQVAAQRLEGKALLHARRAIPHRVLHGCIGIERVKLRRIVEHAAAVVVDEGLRQRAFGEDHIVGVELDVEIFEALDTLGLYDLTPVDQILGLDQDAIEAAGAGSRRLAIEVVTLEICALKVHGMQRRYP